MAIYSGLFNSINGDRRYDAVWFARYFATFIGNGVFPNPSTGLQVIENENMTTTVKAGDGWINGYFIVNDGDYVLQHDLADGVLKRIDRVVMRLNYLSRQIEIEIKKGVFASNPVAPSLQRDADAYELALADVLINNGATQITQANITDTRLDSELCGIVHGLVDQVDTTTLYNQYLDFWEQWRTGKIDEFEQFQLDSQDAFDQQTADNQDTFDNQTVMNQQEFDDWFATVQDILNEDVAGNLLGLIEAHEEKVATFTELGHVKIGENITVEPDGTISVSDYGRLATLTGTDVTIDLSEGNTFEHIITDSTRYTFQVEKSDIANSFRLIIRQSNPVSAIRFSDNVKWDNSEVPFFTYPDSSYVLHFLSVDGGLNWFGRLENQKANIPNGYYLANDSDFDSIRRYTNFDWLKVALPHVINGRLVTSYSGMFSETPVNAVFSNNSMVTNMGNMFQNSSATTLDLSSFDTSNVTNMGNMFRDSSATTLDLSSFDTSNTTNMTTMFYNSSATTLDLSSFDTSNVTNMSSMFHNSSATTLDLSSFDTSNVTNMSSMFYNSSATTLDLSSFDTSNVTNMNAMFRDSSATTLDLSSFDTSNVTNMGNMFHNSSATTLDLSSFDTSNVSGMSNMFNNSSATTLDLSSFDTSNVINMNAMFQNSSATIGYARTQEDADRFNASSGKPAGLTFVVKE